MKTRMYLKAIAAIFSIGFLVLISSAVLANKIYALGNPSWWSYNSSPSFDCDDIPGSFNPPSNNTPDNWGATIGAVWETIDSCTGGNGFSTTENGQGPSIQEWQCVEMVERYMNELFGVPFYIANGYQIGSNYPGGHGLTDVANNSSQNTGPSVGDILSFNQGTQNSKTKAWQYPGGHTAVVEATHYTWSSSGNNGTIDIFQQNPAGIETGIQVTNGIVQGSPGVGPVTDWLHASSSPPAEPDLAVTSGMYTSGNTTLGGNFNANFTVTNEGNAAITIQQLYIEVRGPNGQNVDLGGDGTQKTINPGGTDYIYKSTSDFAQGCQNCNTGTYNVIAQYVDSSGHYQTPRQQSGGQLLAQITGTTAPIVNVTSGITITSYSPTPVGGNFAANFTVTNTGLASLSLHGLDMYVTGPDGAAFDLGANSTTSIAANGGQAGYSVNIPNFGATCTNCFIGGQYTVTARYFDTSGNPHNLTASGSGNASKQFYVVGDTNVTSYQRPDGCLEAFTISMAGTAEYEYNCGSWSGWITIPFINPLMGKIEATKDNAGNLEIFARDTSGTLWFNYQNPANEQFNNGWYTMPSQPVQFAGDPLVFNNADYSNWVDVFVRGTDGNIYQSYTTNSGQSWSAWGDGSFTSNGISFTGDMSEVTDSSNNPWIFTRDNSGPNGTGLVYYNAIQNGAWTGWVKMPSSPDVASDPVGIWDNVYLVVNVFANCSDGNVCHAWQSGGTFTSWQENMDSGAADFNGNLSWAYEQQGYPVLFDESGGEVLFSALSGTTGAWSNWQPLQNSTLIGNVSTVRRSDGLIQAFGLDINDLGQTQYWNEPGGWTGWSSIGSPG